MQKTFFQRNFPTAKLVLAQKLGSHAKADCTDGNTRKKCAQHEWNSALQLCGPVFPRHFPSYLSTFADLQKELTICELKASRSYRGPSEKDTRWCNKSRNPQFNSGEQELFHTRVSFLRAHTLKLLDTFTSADCVSVPFWSARKQNRYENIWKGTQERSGDVSRSRCQYVQTLKQSWWGCQEVTHALSRFDRPDLESACFLQEKGHTWEFVSVKTVRFQPYAGCEGEGVASRHCSEGAVPFGWPRGLQEAVRRVGSVPSTVQGVRKYYIDITPSGSPGFQPGVAQNGN